MDRAAYKSIAAQIKALPRDRYRELADELGRGDADAAARLRVELLRVLRAETPPQEGVSPAELDGRLLVDEDDLRAELGELDLEDDAIEELLGRVVAVLSPATGDGAAARTPKLPEGAVLVDGQTLRAHVERSIRWNLVDNGDKSDDVLEAILASKVDDVLEALRFEEPSDE